MKRKINKKIKAEFTAVCNGHGSAMRSPNCPYEAGYVSFVTGLDFPGGCVRYFNEKRMDEFKLGETYRLSATVTPKGTLQRVRIINSSN